MWFSRLPFTSSGRTPGSWRGILSCFLSSTTSHAGIHAAAIVLPFQLPRASSIIRLSRLRPVNSSAAGSAARRVVVRNILASLLCVLVLVSRLLPDAASSLREVVQPPCRGQAGRFGRFGKPDGRNGRRYLSKWRW